MKLKLVLSLLLLGAFPLFGDTITIPFNVSFANNGPNVYGTTTTPNYSFTFSLDSPTSNYYSSTCPPSGPCTYTVLQYGGTFVGPVGSIQYTSAGGLNLSGSFTDATTSFAYNTGYEGSYYRGVFGNFFVQGSGWSGTGYLNISETSIPGMPGPSGSVTMTVQQTPEPATILLFMVGAFPIIRRFRGLTHGHR